MDGKLSMLKIGMGLMTHIEPILKSVMKIKKNPTHGKQDLIQGGEKYFAVYREIFESESDAEHFIDFCNQVYAMKKDQLPPIHILIVLFKSMLPIMTPKELKGNQAHGKPELRKMDDGNFCVILKEAFTNQEDAQSHLDEATQIKSMRL